MHHDSTLSICFCCGTQLLDITNKYQCNIEHFFSQTLIDDINDTDPTIMEYVSKLVEALSSEIMRKYLVIRRRDARIDMLKELCRKFGLNTFSKIKLQQISSKTTLWRKCVNIKKYIEYQNETVNNLTDLGLRVFKQQLRDNDCWKQSAMSILQTDFALQNQALMQDLDNDQNLGVMKAILYAMKGVTQRQLNVFRMTV